MLCLRTTPVPRVSSPAMASRKARLTRLSRHHAWTLSPSAASAERAIAAHRSGERVSG